MKTKDSDYVDDVNICIQDEEDLTTVDEIFLKFEEMSGAILILKPRTSELKMEGGGNVATIDLQDTHIGSSLSIWKSPASLMYPIFLESPQHPPRNLRGRSGFLAGVNGVFQTGDLQTYLGDTLNQFGGH